MNGQPATVVGVAEAGFRGAFFAELADLWVPLDWRGTRPAAAQSRQGGGDDRAANCGRLAFGSAGSARYPVDAAAARASRAEPALQGQARPYSATAGGNSLVATRGNRMLAVFSAVTFLTIVIVCANVTNLLIARAVVRQREMAVRQSLGASRGRIVRSLLAEGLVLSVVAWVAACLFAWWVSRAVVPFLVPDTAGPVVIPDLTPRLDGGRHMRSSWHCSARSPSRPGPRSVRGSQQLLPFLKVGEQGVVQGRSRLTHGLVVLQLAFSILLLTSAGLARRSLSLQDSLDVGFDTRDILLATVNTVAGATDARHQRDAPGDVARAAREAARRRARLVRARATAVELGRFPGAQRAVRRVGAGSGESRCPRLFRDARCPVRQRAGFHRGAPGSARRSAIVTRQLAATLWPGESAVGKVLLAGRTGQSARVEIVGVVEDAYFGGRGSEGPPRYIFFPSAERPAPPGEATFYIRHRGGLDVMAPAIARALREADRRIPSRACGRSTA